MFFVNVRFSFEVMCFILQFEIARILFGIYFIQEPMMVTPYFISLSIMTPLEVFT
jgi:hypothetical protein